MSGLDVKQAVSVAKEYVGNLFADEGLNNLGLEEVDYDDTNEQWRITLGFSRPWDRAQSIADVMFTKHPRSYKVVTIGKEGRVLSVKNRETTNAG
jgi:hypothetical protein